MVRFFITLIFGHFIMISYEQVVIIAEFLEGSLEATPLVFDKIFSQLNEVDHIYLLFLCLNSQRFPKLLSFLEARTSIKSAPATAAAGGLSFKFSVSFLQTNFGVCKDLLAECEKLCEKNNNEFKFEVTISGRTQQRKMFNLLNSLTTLELVSRSGCGDNGFEDADLTIESLFEQQKLEFINLVESSDLSCRSVFEFSFLTFDFNNLPRITKFCAQVMRIFKEIYSDNLSFLNLLLQTKKFRERSASAEESINKLSSVWAAEFEVTVTNN